MDIIQCLQTTKTYISLIVTQFLPLISNEAGDVRQDQFYSGQHRGEIGNGILTWVFSSQDRSPVVVVQHVGGKGSLQFIAVCIHKNLFLRLLGFVVLGCGFSRRGGCTSCCTLLLLQLDSCLLLVSGPISSILGRSLYTVP